jgi:hypothetical protein
MSDGKLQPGSHGIHHWLSRGINDLEKWANTSRPHSCGRRWCPKRRTHRK